ncbi:tetratricopeptide repeat protein [Collimonas pratensis]|uniref:Tetratrico peptide repeat family protein n=1 Tax=Collimonas pratensis TaxID=279113 RepID=A0ABM5Z8S7_9BURK|nr:tetratricopeptide repeat protein [Collimonas pratensis]AMP15624.1 tetratrico peptide repeat family protein [Collimonas pratensis]
MSHSLPEWEQRLAALWQQIDTIAPEQLVAGVDALAAERPEADPVALFERACVRDTAGLEAEAEPLYRAALASASLDPYRQARASIQLGSSLRLLGQLDESERLISAQLQRYADPAYGTALYDETRAILALTYLAQGRAVEAACLALTTLAPHLSRYNRSVAGNAAEILKNAALASSWS